MVAAEYLGDNLRCLAAREKAVLKRQEITARDEVLSGANDELAVPRRDEVVLDAHEAVRLGLRLLRLRQVQVHLVAVKVCVIRRAHALVEPLTSKNDKSPTYHYSLQILISIRKKPKITSI